MSINYERYVELLSKIIWGTITPHEQQLVAAFEAAAPRFSLRTPRFAPTLNSLAA